MMKGLYTAASGMKVQQINVDVIANNLANVNTAGYKRTQADFQDLLYVILRDPGATSGSGGFASPSGVQIGSGAELVSTTKVFSQGDLEQTDQPLNVAIMGDGFLEVELTNGQKAYTRDGGLRLDANGQLVTAQGYKLSPAITVPTTSDKSISIAPDGTVSARDATGVSSTVGNITIARFSNPSGLRSGGGNLLYQTESSGVAQSGVTPGQSGTGTLAQGMLEKSNVSVVNELVNLITAQRAYEVNSRAIKVGDEMLADASNLVR
jgi:flagellar basal-body rod protein FlgG